MKAFLIGIGLKGARLVDRFLSKCRNPFVAVKPPAGVPFHLKVSDKISGKPINLFKYPVKEVADAKRREVLSGEGKEGEAETSGVPEGRYIVSVDSKGYESLSSGEILIKGALNKIKVIFKLIPINLILKRSGLIGALLGATLGLLLNLQDNWRAFALFSSLLLTLGLGYLLYLSGVKRGLATGLPGLLSVLGTWIGAIIIEAAKPALNRFFLAAETVSSTIPHYESALIVIPLSLIGYIIDLAYYKLISGRVDLRSYGLSFSGLLTVVFALIGFTLANMDISIGGLRQILLFLFLLGVIGLVLGYALGNLLAKRLETPLFRNVLPPAISILLMLMVFLVSPVTGRAALSALGIVAGGALGILYGGVVKELSRGEVKWTPEKVEKVKEEEKCFSGEVRAPALGIVIGRSEGEVTGLNCINHLEEILREKIGPHLHLKFVAGKEGLKEVEPRLKRTIGDIRSKLLEECTSDIDVYMVLSDLNGDIESFNFGVCTAREVAKIICEATQYAYPVYSLVTLPTTTLRVEELGKEKEQLQNGLKKIKEYVDGLLLADPDKFILEEEGIEKALNRLYNEIVKRVGFLLEISEKDIKSEMGLNPTHIYTAFKKKPTVIKEIKCPDDDCPEDEERKGEEEERELKLGTLGYGVMAAKPCVETFRDPTVNLVRQTLTNLLADADLDLSTVKPRKKPGVKDIEKSKLLMVVRGDTRFMPIFKIIRNIKKIFKGIITGVGDIEKRNAKIEAVALVTDIPKHAFTRFKEEKRPTAPPRKPAQISKPPPEKPVEKPLEEIEEKEREKEIDEFKEWSKKTFEEDKVEESKKEDENEVTRFLKGEEQ